ncbi:DNA primase, partial [Streptomyces sp. MCAF7]
MERKGRFSQWLRRPRSGAGGDTGTGAGAAGAREDLLMA